jgi:gamma-glutamylaminecyclotransferase
MSSLNRPSTAISRSTHRVFVYGTLLRGFANHSYLQNASFLGPAMTVDRYALYADIIPFVIRHEAVSRIIGEVYEIDESTLEDLDRLEQHPSWYQRDQVMVELSGGERLQSWLYFYPRPAGRLVESGDFRCIATARMETFHIPKDYRQFYFAYGSNMNSEQMLNCCAGTELHGTGRLAAHRLIFNTDGVVTVVPDAEEEVLGVVWVLGRYHEERLDSFEGVEEKIRLKKYVTIETKEGPLEHVLIYVTCNRTPNEYA